MDHFVLGMYGNTFLADHIEITGQNTHPMSCSIPAFGSFVSTASDSCWRRYSES
jgi:hypothetical protein